MEYFYYSLVLVAAITWTRVTYAQFTPGCSFSSGQCLYNVQLGHQGQCDKATVTSSGSGHCCEAIQSQVSDITNDVNTLKTQVSTLMSELMNSKNNLSAANEQLLEADIKTQQLLQTLAHKEAELNSTQSQLSKVIGEAGNEIRTLRATVGRLTAELNTCKGTLGLATNNYTLPDSSIVPGDVLVGFCDFEHFLEASSNRTCGFINATHDYGFTIGSGSHSSTTGPVEDHTMGSPHGHYAFMDAKNIGLHTTSSSTKTISMTSPQYPPAPGYCVRLWYNMYGHDVRSFNIYAQIASGNGYPVFSHSGSIAREWVLAETDLDSEYTSHPFHVVITATTSAYHSSYGPRYADGDVAIDDIYVYNTSCKNVRLCPPNGITREVGANTYCYTFHTEPATWYQAAIQCRRQGATSSLVTITAKEEQDFIVHTIKNNPVLSAAGQYGYYTAGNDERSEHHFDWTDTGTPYRGTYTDWKAGQPNNVGDDQDCLLLQYPDLDYQWGDVDCDERHPFICKTMYPTRSSSSSAHMTIVG